MNEIEFMRWLTSIGVFECCVPYRHTFNPIRGFWSIEDTCDTRTITLFDTSFNDLYKVLVNDTFDERIEGYKEDISKIFKL